MRSFNCLCDRQSGAGLSVVPPGFALAPQLLLPASAGPAVAGNVGATGCHGPSFPVQKPRLSEGCVLRATARSCAIVCTTDRPCLSDRSSHRLRCWGRPGQRLLIRLAIQTSDDTALRTVRQFAADGTADAAIRNLTSMIGRGVRDRIMARSSWIWICTGLLMCCPIGRVKAWHPGYSSTPESPPSRVTGAGYMPKAPV
jgi:hypothetical protein